MGEQVSYEKNLPEIPSEFIEPYAQRFLMMQIESIAYGLITPKQAREYLSGVQYFIDSFSGIHARFATSNTYYKFCRMKDKDIVKICRKTFNNQPIKP